MLSYLLNLDLEGVLATVSYKDRNKVFKSFVHSELCKHVNDRFARYDITCHRGQRGRVIDFIIEETDGSLVAIVVKATHVLDNNKMRELREFGKRQGKKFKRGIFLHLGSYAFAFGQRDEDADKSKYWLLHASSLFAGRPISGNQLDLDP